MKILSMTATFGKLDRDTLTLQPGLNVIEAPNEWGKSTWCAFLVDMLYGISTSESKKKGYLPERERYMPWSGKPMFGQIQLIWQGRNITIERSAKGKNPFGQFRAYETESGVDIPELTGENCGQVLLGVERTVFTRAGFLRGSDMPVVEDEALRRRLNALVTTGDESGASDTLAQKLKDLKNECRHNRTGLIPQAEGQRDQLLQKLSQLEQLKDQIATLQQQEQQQADYEQKLKNHKVALAYQRSVQTRVHMEKANADLAAKEQNCKALEERCAALPAEQTARQELQRLQQFAQQQEQLQAREEMLPTAPQKPETPAPFAGKDPRQALQQATLDSQEYKKLCKPVSSLFLILAILLLAGAVGMLFVKWIISPVCVLLAVLCFALYMSAKKKQTRDVRTIANRYDSAEPDSWVAMAQSYQSKMDAYEVALQQYRSQVDQLNTRKESLQQAVELLTQGKPLGESVAHWQQVLQLWQELEAAREQCVRARDHAQAVGGMLQAAPAPDQPDELTLSEDQTEQALQQCIFMQNQLHQRKGQCQGQMETLGDKGALEEELARLQERLDQLEDIYTALTIAQDTLTQAATELQRRFAPRLAARAKALFGRLTDGRYDRLQLDADLSMQVAATDEDAAHGVLWRSDGTADQLYLALRLAVAEELTPDAPLVLDDALVRFDDTRTAAALKILKEYAENKQVILFTCQTREKKLVD